MLPKYNIETFFSSMIKDRVINKEKGNKLT
jgi:hypothetical protein